MFGRKKIRSIIFIVIKRRLAIFRISVVSYFNYRLIYRPNIFLFRAAKQL